MGRSSAAPLRVQAGTPCSAKDGAAKEQWQRQECLCYWLAVEDLFEEGQGAGILGLAQPEHGLFADLGIAIRLGHFD
jgi:hypothetical protein